MRLRPRACDLWSGRHGPLGHPIANGGTRGAVAPVGGKGTAAVYVDPQL